MTITTTRTDCERDYVGVRLPNATTLGFGKYYAQPGNWVLYEQGDYHHVGRVICRVQCEDKIYVEVAAATSDFASVMVRWVKPEEVRECRAEPPRRVFDFFAGDWNSPEEIHAKLAHGVSDMKDQLPDLEARLAKL
jgi:hypothetical protein